MNNIGGNMETFYLILAIVFAAISAVVAVLIYIKMKNVKGGDNSKEEIIRTFEQKIDILKASGESSSSILKAWAESTSTGLEAKLAMLQQNNSESISSMQKEVQEKLKDLRDMNEKQLDQMRETVNEKMTKILNERIDQSFIVVTDKLEGLNRNLGEMQKLSEGVIDLNKMLANNKLRGNWGEASLEMIIDETLTSELYEKQFSCGPKKGSQVDFAIKLPGSDGISKVYLPIDAKFPIENYMRLIENRSKGNKAETEKDIKDLKAAIKKEAKSIAEKYIDVPNTTDFAIMYLPSEGLYAEVVSLSGLAQEVQNENKVIITGPTTISALLQSLRIGFKTLQIQKSSADMVKLLKGFSKDFNKFVDALNRTKAQLDTANRSIADAASRSLNIKTQLDNIGKLGGGDEEETPVIEE